MRVLFITGEFPPMQGGVGDYTREIGLALCDQGCDVHIVTSTQAGPLPGLAVHAVVERWNWGCWGIILKSVRRLRPDVVHIQYQAAAYAMHPAINFVPWRLCWPGANRSRTVTTFHDLRVPYLFPKAGPLRRWVVDELARRSDAVITTNREDYHSLKQRLTPPPQGRLTVSECSSEMAHAPALIPIGSNITPKLPDGYDRRAWRARWGAGPDDLLLCFFGFVNDRKGVDTLVQALHLLVSTAPDATRGGEADHVRIDAYMGGPRSKPVGVEPHSTVAQDTPLANPSLLMIGGQTGASDPTNVAYLSHIQALIAKLGLQGRVHWTGYLPSEQITASFAAADLCVLPFREGVSFLHGTFHAALAHGLPIITTRPRVYAENLPSGESASPLLELVHEGNVYLVPPEHPKALAEAITRLAASPSLRHTLAGGARALSEQFRWDRIAADTLDLYEELGPRQRSTAQP